MVYNIACAHIPDKAVCEQVEAIKEIIVDGGLTPQPVGPLMDYITSPQAKYAIPSAEALTTFLVFTAKEAL